MLLIICYKKLRFANFVYHELFVGKLFGRRILCDVTICLQFHVFIDFFFILGKILIFLRKKIFIWERTMECGECGLDCVRFACYDGGLFVDWVGIFCVFFFFLRLLGYGIGGLEALVGDSGYFWFKQSKFL